MEIKLYPDKILRQKCLPISREELSDWREFINKMVESVEKDPGAAGLAAPQIGLSKQIAVVSFGSQTYVLINPKIVGRSREKSIEEEGCLSLPGLFLPVKRAKEVKVVFWNQEGQEQKIVAKGFLARAAQHEIDHLAGKLFIDRLGFWQKIKVKKILKKFLGK